MVYYAHFEKKMDRSFNEFNIGRGRVGPMEAKDD
jgi:hypothetical protein